MSTRIKNNILLLSDAIKTGIVLSMQTSIKYFTYRIICILLATSIPYGALYLMKLIVNSLTQSSTIVTNSIGNNMCMALIAYVFINLILQLTNYLSRFTQSMHDEMIECKIAHDIMQRNLLVDVEQFDDPDFYDCMQTATVNSIALINVVWNFFNAISGLISLSIAIAMLYQFNAVFSYVLIIAGIPVSIVNHRYIKKLFTWHLDHAYEVRRKNYYQMLSLDLDYLKEIRLYNLSESLLTKHRTITDGLIREKRSVQKKQLQNSIIASCFPQIITFVMLYICAVHVVDNTYTVGDFTLYSGLITSAGSAIMGFTDSISNIYEDRLKIENYISFLRYSITIKDEGDLVLGTDMPLEIEFKDVYFSYPKSDKPVLNGVSFRIKKQEKTCIVGENGSGKSTLIKLLLRLYDIRDGEIIINGHDIKDYSLKSLRNAISVSFQNAVLFPASFFENIVMSGIRDDKFYDIERYKKTLVWSGVDSIIDNFVEKDQKYIGRVFSRNGYIPSGGEAQRISLARAIYRNSAMIVFDEPSTFLDAEKEKHFYEDFSDICNGKTAIMITHNYESAKYVDKVFVIKNGHIIEYGTMQELLEKQGEFFRLFHADEKDVI